MRGPAIFFLNSKSTEESLILLLFPGLRPKRTLRLVLWTAEEQGGVGSSQYYQLHKVGEQPRIAGRLHKWYQCKYTKSTGALDLKMSSIVLKTQQHSVVGWPWQTPLAEIFLIQPYKGEHPGELQDFLFLH